MSFGQSVAWGQYVVGGLTTLFILVPVFGASPMSAALIEIAFEGGHGTAAGLTDTFSRLGFEEGADLALGLATVGVVSGVLLGIVLINWGRHRHAVFLKGREGLDQAKCLGSFQREIEPRGPS